jgi:transketolase
MREIPGMTVLQPADDVTTQAAVRFAVSHQGPVYLRLTRQKLPPLYRSEQIFQCGRGILLKEGKELALIGSGATVCEALKASEDLSEHSPWVIDMHTLKPIDRALLKTLAHNCRAIATVEDHSTSGGLGTAVAEVLAEEGYRGRLLRLGLADQYGESGPPAELYEKFGISATQIAARVRQLLATMKG